MKHMMSLMLVRAQRNHHTSPSCSASCSVMHLQLSFAQRFKHTMGFLKCCTNEAPLSFNRFPEQVLA